MAMSYCRGARCGHSTCYSIGLDLDAVAASQPYYAVLSMLMRNVAFNSSLLFLVIELVFCQCQERNRDLIIFYVTS
jgi:hypothetical protein